MLNEEEVHVGSVATETGGFSYSGGSSHTASGSESQSDRPQSICTRAEKKKYLSEVFDDRPWLISAASVFPIS